MIKINPNHSVDFLARYEEYVITSRLIPKLRLLINEVPLEYRLIVSGIFTPEFIRELVLDDASALRGKISYIYDRLYIFAERYCLEYCLRNLNIDLNIPNIDIRTRAGSTAISTIYAQVLIDLQQISDVNSSIYLPILIASINNATSTAQQKKALLLLISKKNGNHIYTEEQKQQYPSWISKLAKAFDYETMSRKFGHEITSNIDLDICPYCNNEDIETISTIGAEIRPDLDHFFPKSKFPFLALTLSNLIPAGHICNQKYKKANSMLDFLSPFLAGIGNDPLFNFNYMFDEGRNPDHLNINLQEQGNLLDKNFKLFRIKEIYNKKNIKSWFIDFHERYAILANAGENELNNVLDNENLIRIYLDVNIQKSPRSGQFQKLKIDALNMLSGKQFEIID